MTPEQLTGLGILVLELREWMADYEGPSLDCLVVDHTLQILARLRRELTEAGAK